MRENYVTQWNGTGSAASGGGKTTITCALLAAMTENLQFVRSKADQTILIPCFVGVIGVPSRNLDTFFSGADQIRELYGYDRESFSYSVIREPWDYTMA